MNISVARWVKTQLVEAMARNILKTSLDSAKFSIIFQVSAKQKESYFIDIYKFTKHAAITRTYGRFYSGASRLF